MGILLILAYEAPIAMAEADDTAEWPFDDSVSTQSVNSPAVSQPPSLAPATQSPPRSPGGFMNAIPTALPTGGNVAVIQLEGLIYDYHLKSLKEQVDQALAQGASVIVIELDTPGGILDSALRISKYIRSIPALTVAWINPDAYSAGILIAAACQRIVMAPISATGDCAPIAMGQNLMPTERAKALSPLLLEFRESAIQNGHEYLLFHAMCVLGIEVYQVRHTQTGQERLVNQADYAVMVKGASPDGSFLNSLWPSSPEEDLSVMEAKVTVATEADRGQWELVKKIHDGQTLLTVSQNGAIEVGLADAVVKDTQELQQFLGASQLKVYSPNPLALTAYWLSQPWVRALLMLALLVGAYIELQSPGLGLGGLVAVTALVLLLVAPFLVDLAQMWHVVLFFIGLGLLLVELFIVPGFGVVGAAGIVCMFAGLVLMGVATTGQGWAPLPAPEWGQRLRLSVIYGLASVLASLIAFYFLTKHFGNLPVLGRLILETSPVPSALGADGKSGLRTTSNGAIVLGALGRAVSTLRPSGSIEIGDQIIDAVTRGQWIEAGQPVRITEVRSNHVVVDPM